MQSELNDRGNKYDILDFLFRQGKAVIGLESLPPTISALSRAAEERRREEMDRAERELLAAKEAEAADDDKDPNVVELPQKVDQFVEYINQTYFDGHLNVNDAEMLKKGIGGGDDDDGDEGDVGGLGGAPRRVFNSDDATGTSPALPRRIFMS